MNVKFLAQLSFSSSAVLAGVIITLASCTTLPLAIWTAIVIRTASPSPALLTGASLALLVTLLITPWLFVQKGNVRRSSFAIFNGNIKWLTFAAITGILFPPGENFFAQTRSSVYSHLGFGDRPARNTVFFQQPVNDHRRLAKLAGNLVNRFSFINIKPSKVIGRNKRRFRLSPFQHIRSVKQNWAKFAGDWQFVLANSPADNTLRLAGEFNSLSYGN